MQIKNTPMMKLLTRLLDQKSKYCLSFLMLLLISSQIALSQTLNRHNLGTKKDFILKLRNKIESNKKLSEESDFVLNLDSKTVIKSKIKYFRKGTTELYAGEVFFPFKGQISIMIDTIEGLSGHIYSVKNKIAYSLTADSQDQVYADSVDINKIICIDYAAADVLTDTLVIQEALVDTVDAYKLQSLPTATAVIYLDFDGETVTGTSWNSTNATIVAPPITFTQAQIKSMWKMVSEDYMPFNINVTTDRAVFDLAAVKHKTQCIFTTNDEVAVGAGGVSYVGSFRRSPMNPCWVFNKGVKSAGEAASHEVGHTMGLSHDGRNTTPVEPYFLGQGIGPSPTSSNGLKYAWAPIMGASYYAPLGQWSKGEYNLANNKEDDLAIIASTGTSTSNGFGYKPDDHANVITGATVLNIETTGNVINTKNEGVITTRTDVDVFKFTTSGGNVSLQVKPAAADPDLDISVRILDANGAVVTTSTQTGLILDVNITTLSLTQGTYYIEVDGVGDGDPLTNGYSDYSSLGFYSISGTIPVAAAVLTTVASDNANSDFKIKVVPNPFSSSATITLPDSEKSTIKFFNVEGKLVFETTAIGSMLINNQISPGIYFMVVITKDKVFNKKLVKE